MLQKLFLWLRDPVIADRLNDAAPYLLVSAGLLGLIAIAGGGKLALKDVSVGELGPASRALAGATATLLALLWLITPPPDVLPKLTVSGRLIAGAGASFDVRPIEVGLQRHPEDIERTRVDHDLRFTFPASDKIQDGTYNLVMYGEQGGRLSDTLVTVRDQEELIVTRLADGSYRQDSAGNAVETVLQARNRYADHKWEQKLQGLHILIELARVQPNLQEELEKQIDSDDAVMRDMASFALATLRCNPRAIDYLRNEVVDKDSNEFRRLRAAFAITCDPNQRDYANAILRNRMATSDRPAIRRAAAYYLAKLGSRTECVVQHLISGLGNKSDFVVDLSHEALVVLTARDFQNDIGRWNAWFDETDELTPCLWLQESYEMKKAIQ